MLLAQKTGHLLRENTFPILFHHRRTTTDQAPPNWPPIPTYHPRSLLENQNLTFLPSSFGIRSQTRSYFVSMLIGCSYYAICCSIRHRILFLWLNVACLKS